jgi:hypothetical protein
VTGEKWFVVSSLAVMLLFSMVRTYTSADAQAGDPCSDWRQSASETMFRVAAAQSRAEEGINLLRDLLERHNAGEAGALALLKRQRKRFEPMVEEAVAASGLAAGEAERLKQLLKGAVLRCPDEELHGMRYTQWWFENHGPIVKMRPSYLAAARLDFSRAQSIFEEVIASGGESKNPESKRENDRAKRALAMVKMKKVPFLRPERSYQEREHPAKGPPPPDYIPEHIPKPERTKP